MPNRLASYKNPEILEVVATWFERKHNNDIDYFVTLAELYQSYYEFTLPPMYTFQRLNINEFAKCLVACKIIDIGGKYTHLPDHIPAPSAITRATA